jgi:hypothetical protein
MKTERLHRLKELLAARQCLSPRLAEVIAAEVGYTCSEPGKVAELLDVWRHRARWNKNHQNTQAGKLIGIDETVLQLEAHAADSVVGHSIQSAKGVWMIFTDPEIKELYGVIENTTKPTQLNHT